MFVFACGPDGRFSEKNSAKPMPLLPNSTQRLLVCGGARLSPSTPKRYRELFRLNTSPRLGLVPIPTVRD